MKKVYIINDSGHDFSMAEKYGELVTLSRGEVNKFRPTQMLREFKPVLMESSPDDFIIHSGPNVMTSMACALFAVLHNRLNLLLWRINENGEETYVVQRIVFQ